MQYFRQLLAKFRQPFSTWRLRATTTILICWFAFVALWLTNLNQIYSSNATWGVVWLVVSAIGILATTILGYQVMNRLAEQENLRIQLQTAAELAADLGSLLDRDALLQKTIDLMQERFGLYYVGIFLSDETEGYAHLRAGTGRAGAEQIAQGHRLEIGGKSLIGGAVADGQPRVHQDVLLAADWFANPLLPDTRSEIAMPLRARGRVLGAVTAQSVETGKFNAALVRVLQTMCDQIAIALDNSDLFTQLESQIHISDHMNQAEQRLIGAETKDAVYDTLHDFAEKSGQFDFISLIAPLSIAYASNELKIVPSNESIGAILPKAFLQVHDLIDYRRHAEELPAEVNSWLAYNKLSQVLLIPLQKNREWLGTIVLGLKQINPQPREIIEPVSALARQATSVLINLELIRETSALYDLSRTLSQAISQEHVARITVDEIVRYTQVEQCRIFLLDEKEHDEAYIIASHQPIAEGQTSFNVDQDPLINHLRENRQMILINRSEQQTSQEIINRYLRPYGIESSLAIPAYSQFKLIGFITLDSLNPHWEPGEVQRRFARTTAEQFIITFENMVLFDEALKRAQELVAINQIGARIASTLNEAEIAAIVQSDLQTLIPHDIFLMGDVKNDKMVPLLHINDGVEQKIKPITIGQKVSAWLFRSEEIKTARLHDREFAIMSRAFNLTHAKLQHLAFAAFSKENGQKGFILLGSGGVDRFVPEELQLLRAVTNQTALGLSNARLLQETQENVAELRALFNVTQAVASSVSADDRISNTVRTLHRSLRQAHLGIVLIDQGDILSLINAVGELPHLPKYQDELPIALTKKLLQQNQPVWLDTDTKSHDIIYRFYPECPAEIVLPLSIGQHTIGFLTAGHPLENRFSQRDLRVLQTVCISLAATIENGRLFDQIQAANDKLQELDKMKTQFLANMSHELRTPLNSIIGFSRLILKGIDGPITDSQEEDLSSIYNSGLHLLNLINDILDLAKLDAGKMGLVIETVNLNQIAESVLATARGLVRDKSIELKWEIDADLPDIEADQMRLRQILLNLLSNAAKFTEEGQITLKITTLTGFDEDEQPGEFVQLSVADTGVGIEEDDFPRLFAKFEQIDASPTRAKDGTGLGLPIVHELVQLHNGRVWVESTLQEGSTFYVLLPIKQENEQMFLKRHTRPLVPAAHQNGQVENHGQNGVTSLPEAAVGSGQENGEAAPAILLVDDEPGILSFYQRNLGHLPNEIVTAHNGGEALAQLSNRPEDFGLVLLDIHMPETSGWDVLQEIRSQPNLKSLPVIVCSVDISQSEAEKHGAQMALTKPIISDDLTKVMELINKTS
ncbi:MAG: GAF domain-containing protein [Ardenticatenaceae bacterium]|nr:GAF domain-containing protein [Ardenticatenaceae bacterium]